MHGIAAITGNMHRSLRYFVLLERITSSKTRLYWRASGVSETVLGVDNAKSGIMFDVYVWIVRMPLKRACGYRFFS